MDLATSILFATIVAGTPLWLMNCALFGTTGVTTIATLGV